MELKKLIAKILIVVITFAILVFLVIANELFFQNKYLNNQTLSKDEYEKIIDERENYEKVIHLYYNNLEIPYSYTEEFFLLSVQKEDDYKKIYVKEDFKIAFIEQKEKYSFELLLYNDKYYKVVNLNITNLPVMNIKNTKDLDLFGFDADMDSLKCKYNLRGDSSQFSKKKSYRLQLLTKKGKDISLSLLNMNNSNDWILNPIYFDDSYIREKLSYEIWNGTTNSFKHNLEYIELFMDGEYLGIYYLQEPVDMATFNGDNKKDFLLSIDSWGTMNLAEENKYNPDEYMEKFSAEAGLENNFDEQVKIMREFSNYITKHDVKDYGFIYDIFNLSNYFNFVNFTMSADNVYKNQKILFRNFGEKTYIIQKTVWDLDWAFANKNIKSTYGVDIDVNEIIYDVAVPEYIINSDIFYLISKWNYILVYKKRYPVQKLYQLIDSYTSYLEEYGAVNRDSKKWDNKSYEKEIENIKKTISQRINRLDEYFGGKNGVSH